MIINLKYRLILAAVLANLSTFTFGTCLGWMSPMGPKLTDPELKDTPLSFVIDFHSKKFAWIGSIIGIGALTAPYAAGPLADKIGRKWTLLSTSFFFFLSYLLLLTTSSVEQILIARLFQGFGVGFVLTVLPMYIGEISTDDTRGPLGSLLQFFLVSGVLYVYAVGPHVSYHALQWSCIFLPLLFAATFAFMPESPYFFMIKGRKDDAIKSLQFLRGQSRDGDVQDELFLIETTVEESMKKRGTVMDIIKNKGNLKALIICCGLIIFQQMSGINAVLFNAQRIFIKANTGLNPSIAPILMSIVQLVSSSCTPFLAIRFGRRTILLVSSSVMCLSLLLLGLFFYLDSTDLDTSSFSFVPIVSLIIYVMVFTTGFGPLPWVVVGEMFASNIKSKASTLVASICWIISFLITNFTPRLGVSLGIYVPAWIFSCFCGAAFFFVMFVLIETKGLSLQQIQNKLNVGTKVKYNA